MPAASETHFRTCPFCEATCGLRVEVADGEVVSIRGDADDVLSKGFICPKAFGLKELREDPDRLTAPLVRRDGELREATWDEAFAAIDAGLGPILEEGGRDAVAVYAGNPTAHNLAAMIYLRVFLRALGSQEHLLGVVGGPDAEALLRRPHVRPLDLDPGAGRRPHRPPDDLGGEPAGLEREPPDRARYARANPPRSRSAAARSS